MTEWFDSQFEQDRFELSEIEYSAPLSTNIIEDDMELDEGEEICSCDVSERLCPLHNILEDEENNTKA